jgi:hypothetical protein
MATFPGLIGRPLSKESVEERQMDDDLCLFDVENPESSVHILNSSAAVVWYLCDGEHEVESIASHIALTFARPYDGVLTDVRETVDRLHRLGLVRLK